MRFIESLDMTDDVEDWSRVRSPSRAERRRRRGHQQAIVIHKVPKRYAITTDGQTFIAHPLFVREVRAQMAKLKEAL